MIESNKIYTEGYKILKDFLNNNLIDPRKRFKTQWIHNSSPDVTAKGFEGYPFITVKMNVGQTNNSFDIVTAENRFNIEIGIYTDEPTEMDELSNQLYSKLNDKDLVYNLNDFKVKVISSSNVSTVMVNSKKIYLRLFNISAKLRLNSVQN